MGEDRIKGSAHQAKGKIKEVAGNHAALEQFGAPDRPPGKQRSQGAKENPVPGLSILPAR